MWAPSQVLSHFAALRQRLQLLYVRSWPGTSQRSSCSSPLRQVGPVRLEPMILVPRYEQHVLRNSRVWQLYTLQDAFH